MDTIYRKVEIKNERDLPKEKDKYFVKLKHGIRTVCNFHSRNHKIWMERVEYYLQPIEPQEPENTDKCNINGFTGECVKCPIHKTCEDYTGKIQPKEHPKTAEEIPYKVNQDVRKVLLSVALNGYDVVCAESDIIKIIKGLNESK